METNDKKMYKKGLLTGVLISLSIFMLCIIGIFIFVYRSSEVLSPRVKSKIEYLTNIIEKTYYDEVDVSKLQEGLYKGLVEGLGDKYSTYYSPEEATEFSSHISGEFCGLGATLTQNSDGTVEVRKVYEGSSAQDIGLKVGDIIIAADDKIAATMELSDFTSYTRGSEGTKFELTYRSGDVEKKAIVTRKKVDIPSVSYKMLEGNIGYIEISEFNKKTHEEYTAAINDLKAQGAKGVIFDLRFNGGGIVDSATAILDDILPECKIVTLAQRDKEDIVYNSDGMNSLDMPIAVLVSGRTASAAEIFAAAIRDNNYGTLIGYKTYGKGVIQTSAALEDGSVISITSGKYYTPNGECINEKGIEPDIEVEFEYSGDTSAGYDEMKDSQVLKAIEVINGNQSN
ncbi:MAG: S41 family peptidase [Lachnospiraceae bacterium]|nr:S41 family peptidase [Lachnospiraceae bacterium]